MHIALLSDIHGNLPALEAVLAQIKSRDIQQVWFLGDIAGYGPCASECLELIRENADLILKGHTDMCLQEEGDISPWLQETLSYAKENLSDDQQAFIKNLPTSRLLTIRTRSGKRTSTLCVAHSTPRGHELILDTKAARDSLEGDYYYLFSGHTHIPSSYEKSSRKSELRVRAAGETLSMKSDARYFINPGSVGNSRDKDPRASWGILNLSHDGRPASFTWEKTEYDVAAFHAQCQEAGLPLWSPELATTTPATSI